MEYSTLIPELIVSDIEKTYVFYVDLLGFQVEYERPEDKFYFLSYGDAQLMIEEASEEELSQLIYPFGYGLNFSLGVDDVSATYQAFQTAGYPIRRELEVREFRVGDDVVRPKEFAVLDPDGYYWRISD
ncbi:bleomycin resistance protein [Streptococcus halotolerans]|uniref:bleomycin resistance protein n=1 Tax=Streptococcus halotolerans TaxID=1814128 RepID=UPI000788C7DE|nr:VOC family protein [Streptococcus halotolerans]